MLVYGRNVAERIFKDEKLLKKVRKLKIEEKYYLKIQNSLGEFAKSKVKLARKSEIDNLTKENHQGIIIDMEDYQYTPLSKILEKEYDKVLILDHILDPHNFGAIIRTAVAAGFNAIIIPNDRQVLVNSTVVKTSVGAVFDIDIVLVTNLNNTIKTLKDNGFWIYGTVMDGEDYTSVDYNGKVCLIIGNEEKGMSKLVKESCDFLITIPISSKIDSLNASVAAGILIYEVVRSRK
ncbi:MAG TPA: 23S rRNA (guanosine(2251)-2'-O)-methyltransferase RlmB [Candidatus Onthousia faecipullorum]|uniref:23S rRNA (Guanosine(2251)-2'-O)-methyltransferase RlmB n=1 Tax=Candidatus Onthousia faecipullorum TaxID=2840887 RepID=A0A9D1GAY0_9FIRM|nr:23S rRNA (guanosine(2251)-2'-O)-methyltransferase RlmB [Candidatus Onthousia faecipullorum]